MGGKPILSVNNTDIDSKTESSVGATSSADSRCIRTSVSERKTQKSTSGHSTSRTSASNNSKRASSSSGYSLSRTSSHYSQRFKRSTPGHSSSESSKPDRASQHPLSPGPVASISTHLSTSDSTTSRPRVSNPVAQQPLYAAGRVPVMFWKLQFDEETCSIRVGCTAPLTHQKLQEMFPNLRSVRKEEDLFVLRYPGKEHAFVDLKANRKHVSKEENGGMYMDNKYLLNNLPYKETEESIAKAFTRYGEVERVVLKRNKDGISVGRATITFKNKATIREEVILGSKPVYVERIKMPSQNRKRFFLGMLDKSLSIVQIRKALVEAGCKPVDIRVIYGENKRNKGYGFIEYASDEKADVFTEKFNEIRHLLGEECYYEYSNEKTEKERERRVKKRR